MSDSNDEWNFKIDDKHKKSEPKNSSGVAKKRSLEDIAKAFEPEKPMDLALDHDALPSRETRNANFNKTVALERFAEIKPAPIGRRIKASVIDLLFVSVFMIASLLSFPLYRTYLERSLPSGMLANVPYPQLVLEYTIPFLVFLFLHIFPSCIWRKSLGKKLCDIRIGWQDEDCGVPKKAILWRELIAKPLSVISVLGLLLAFTNKRFRTLHDFLSGTVVYDEL